MVAVPVATPNTTPVLELIVAMLVFELLQAPPPALELRVVFPLVQMDWLPLSVPADDGQLVTVIL